MSIYGYDDGHALAVRATEWLERITYRPGWKIRVTDDVLTGYVAVVVDALVADSYGLRSGEHVVAHFVQLRSEYLADEWRDFGSFVRWVRHRLGEVEHHERDEWLKVDGAPAFDPHSREVSRALLP